MGYIENINFHPSGHPHSNDLAGKAIRLEYSSGHTLEQHWQSESRVFWKGISGALDGHAQTENYRAIKLAEGLYLVTWVEESTVATTNGAQSIGPWLTDIVIDFNHMRATASWMGPTVDGVEYVLDQAVISYVDCDQNKR